LLVKSEQGGASLFKIVKHLEYETTKQTGMVEYCLQELRGMCDPESKGSTEKWTSVLAVVIKMLEKDKSGELEASLRKMSKQLGRLLLHRKRPIRQAVRRMLALIQE
jgi:predicted PilT family ATPase